MKDYEEKQLQIYQNGLEQLGRMKSYSIVDESTAGVVGEARKQVSAILKKIEENRKDVTSGLNDTLRKINKQAKEARAPYEESRKLLDKELLRWEDQQAKQRAMAEAQLEEVDESDPESLKALLVASVEQAKRAKGIKVRKTWDFKVMDITLVPQKFVVLDVCKKSIKQAIKEGVREIDGIHIFQKESISE